MTLSDARPARVQVDPGADPPVVSGSFADAERLRKWSFRKRSYQQRYEWLVSVLKVIYQRDARKLPPPTSPSSEHDER